MRFVGNITTGGAASGEVAIRADFMAYEVEINPNATTGYEFRGDVRKALGSKAPRMMLSGPADSGKTILSCAKLHLACLKYPGSQHAMFRKTAASISGSVAQTFDRVTAGGPLRKLGGSKATQYQYHNGSTIWVGGLDNPSRALSSERDMIYVNQAEEITLEDWEMISTRCTGRAAIVPYPQLFGDCNPAGSKHWIVESAKAGTLELFHAKHQDNPTIYDKQGNLTYSGARRLEALKSLTGVRRKRLYEGLWVTSEGAIYDGFDAQVHVKERPDKEFKRWFLTVDEGYTNPAVILIVGEDADGRWHVAREFYRTGVLQADIVATAASWFREKNCEIAAVDESAAGLIADMIDAGINAVGGKGRVLDGIQRIQNRLTVAGDGMPRLTVDPACKEIVNEFESYVWADGKDVPVKEYDHALDAMRYLGDALGENVGAFTQQHIDRLRIGDRGEYDGFELFNQQDIDLV